jgi:hypothetical protein
MMDNQFNWSQMGLSVILMVIMAFFCTGGVEVFKDVFYFWLVLVNKIANKFRAVRKVISPETNVFSATASKFIAFSVAFWMCIVFDYGAIKDIVQYGVEEKGKWASYTDYILTASIIRLGAVQVYDLLAMLTEKAIAAKALAQKLTQTGSITTEEQTVKRTSSISEVRQ